MMIGDIFKILFWDTAVNAGLAALATAAPWLMVGPWGWVIRQVILKYTDLLYAGMRMVANLEAIVLINEDHRKAYDRASAELQIIAHDKGIDSPEFKEARIENQKALLEFVRFRPPPI